ncbi:MAG: ABC transporter ATP-binding protein/permease [Firmicutes bacterium]|jgi:ATP-binding cassette subfamily B protein|nr:ABC transporter ATP-binding protein/permease [Bacillota bacterium]
MINILQNRYAMSKKGAKDLMSSIIWTLLLDFSFMLPVIISFKYIDETLFNDSIKSQGSRLIYYIGISLVFFIIMYVIAYYQYDSTYTKIYEESAKRRISLAEKLRKLPLAFFGKKDISDLSSTIMEDATQIETLFSHAVPQIYGAILSVLVMGIMMFFYNWRLSLAIFWVVPVAAIIFYLSKGLQKKMHENLYYVKRDISDIIQEQLDSAQEIKAYNRENDFSNDLDKELDGYEKLMIRGELLIGATINLSYVFLKLGLPSVVVYGAHLLSIEKIDIFTYLVFLVVASRIYNPIMDVMSNFALLNFLDVRINRMKEMDNMPVQEGNSDFEPKHFDIEFKDVDFSYQEDVQTLKNVSFKAKQGEVTALVGPSGGGKSTVAKLSARFWDTDNGRITLGGEDISKVDPETLLDSYSIVFQDVTLFNSSVFDNIKIGKKSASESEVRRAAKLAQCDEFICKLPDGYNTYIGENGERLSGGERQRISIARAILKDSPIILLDEATASLDAENESKIQMALSELVKDKTVMIIAHRMRTVLEADNIVVLKDGEIKEIGSPSELRSKNGIFNSMVEKQYMS